LPAAASPNAGAAELADGATPPAVARFSGAAI